MTAGAEKHTIVPHFHCAIHSNLTAEDYFPQQRKRSNYHLILPPSLYFGRTKKRRNEKGTTARSIMFLNN